MTKCEIINEILKYRPKAKKSLLWSRTKEKLYAYLEAVSGKPNK